MDFGRPRTAASRVAYVLRPGSPLIKRAVTANSDPPDGEALDENGDGLDGVIALGLFVHPELGSDQNSGHADAPLMSLGRAIERLIEHQESRPLEAPLTIFLAAGDYILDPVDVSFDLSIAGGYLARSENGALSWSRSTMNERGADESLLSVIRTDRAGPIFTVRSPEVNLDLDGLRLDSLTHR